jgi:hypothetical protein
VCALPKLLAFHVRASHRRSSRSENERERALMSVRVSDELRQFEREKARGRREGRLFSPLNIRWGSI